VAILVLACALGPVSGCHLNPSVSLSLWLSRSQPGLGIAQLVANVAAQCAGGLLGAAALLGTTDPAGGSSLGANVVSPRVSNASALLGESLMTGLLCFVVLMTVAGGGRGGPSKLAPIAIGLAVFLGNALLIPIDGASLNFARSLGPAVVAGEWSTEQYGSTAQDPVYGPGRFWIFFLGPLLGALGALPAWWVLKAPAEDADAPDAPTARGEDDVAA
jgi:glycerol uptake facilitator-like aquaporin